LVALGQSHADLQNGDITPEEFGELRKREMKGLTPREQAAKLKGSLGVSLSIKAERSQRNREAGNQMFTTLSTLGVQSGGSLLRASSNFVNARGLEEREQAADVLNKEVRNSDKLRSDRAAAARKLNLDERTALLQQMDWDKTALELRALERADQVGSAEHIVKMGEVRRDGFVRAGKIEGTLTQSDLVKMEEDLINKDGSIRDPENSMPKIYTMQATQYRLGLPITVTRKGGLGLGGRPDVLGNFDPHKAEKMIRVLTGRQGGSKEEAVVFLNSIGYDFFDPGGGVVRKGFEDFGPIWPGPGGNENLFSMAPGVHSDTGILGKIQEMDGLVGTFEDEEEITVDNWRTFEGDRPGQLERDRQLPLSGSSVTGPSARSALGVQGTGGPQLAPGEERFTPQGTTGETAARDTIEFLGGFAEKKRQTLQEIPAKIKEAQGARTNVLDFIETFLREGRRAQ
jgi:hypothetical protein